MKGKKCGTGKTVSFLLAALLLLSLVGNLVLFLQYQQKSDQLAGAQERAGDHVRQAVLTVGSCQLTEESDRQKVEDSLFSVYLYMSDWREMGGTTPEDVNGYYGLCMVYRTAIAEYGEGQVPFDALQHDLALFSQLVRDEELIPFEEAARLFRENHRVDYTAEWTTPYLPSELKS